MSPRRAVSCTLAAVLASACTRSGDASSSFSSGPPPDSAAASDGTTVGGSANEGSAADTGTSSSGSPVDVSTSAAPGSTGSFDVGAQPDFEPPPEGCKGKIDFLFLISRGWLMETRQAQLAAAFPKFIDTIESKFADFDYHIMVVDGDDTWGVSYCTDSCPTLECKQGDPCCGVPDYPCEHLDLVTPCDTMWGSGTVLPAGGFASNKPCPIDGGRRFLAKGQKDLDETFKCIATVGGSGRDDLGQALVAAVDPQINGGCNNGFLRDDALLMVTFIHSTGDTPSDSEGTPAEWKQAVLDAKHGDERSVVVFHIGFPECMGDRICEFTKMWPHQHSIHGAEPDYGPGFVEAASLVDTACAEFVPPPG